MTTLLQLLSSPVPPVLFLLLLTCGLILLVVILLRTRPVNIWPITSEIQSLGEALERLDRALKDDISRNRTELVQMSRGQREELTGVLDRFGEAILARHNEMSADQRDRFSGFTARVDNLSINTQQRLDQIREAMGQSATDLRKEVLETVRHLTEAVNSQMDAQVKRQTEQLDAFAARFNTLTQTVSERLDSLAQSTEQRQEALRTAIAESSKVFREETSNNLQGMTNTVQEMRKGNDERSEGLRQTVETQLGRISETTVQKIDQMREAIAVSSAQSRGELAKSLQGFGDTLNTRMAKLTETNEQKMEALRQVVDGRLVQLREDNETKLEQMRKTVDEHLHGTLEKRLGESFKLVSERLEQVHKGLGEMQTLATGVGDLKRVLTNVKSRGTWGEVQLERLLEQIFSPGQYLKNVCTREDSREQVEFAVRVAGRDDDGTEMLLPIDSKCPVEDYERLLAALDAGDMAQAELSSRQLETRLKACAKDIRDKYLNPPRTTSYGVMFLPSEGLFAEALRRPGLVETLQREYRVVIAGPTTLAAILTSVQMGIAINQITRRSTEVWKILGAVKIEFRKYGDAVDKVRGSLSAAANNLERVSTRSRALERKLKTVEELPEAEAQGILAEVESDFANGEDAEVTEPDCVDQG
ncbi:MAG: DNA recombination protein RmuC [Desulfovibrionaceae bacterium]